MVRELFEHTDEAGDVLLVNEHQGAPEGPKVTVIAPEPVVLSGGDARVLAARLNRWADELGVPPYSEHTKG